MAERRKSVHHGHRQRMRARFLDSGERSFSDHELLEMLLYQLSPRADTNPVAHALLDRAGGLDALFSADAERLAEIAAGAEHCPRTLPLLTGLVSAFETVYLTDKCNANIGRTNINDARSVARYALEALAGCESEVTKLICLDSRMSVKCCLPLRIGRPTGDRLFAEAHRLAVSREAKCVIVIFNHLDGNPAFTQEELSALRRLSGSFETAGIRLLDGVLCCDGNAVRLCATGLLHP